jgi:hypothetical protein
VSVSVVLFILILSLWVLLFSVLVKKNLIDMVFLFKSFFSVSLLLAVFYLKILSFQKFQVPILVLTIMAFLLMTLFLYAIYEILTKENVNLD